MTHEELFSLADKVGLGFIRHASDKDIEKFEAFAKLVAQREREACAEIADRLPRIYRETKDAHERLSMEPFKPSNFGFDFAVLQHAEKITHSIRARGTK